jgi:hypothetical protein
VQGPEFKTPIPQKKKRNSDFSSLANKHVKEFFFFCGAEV